MPLRDRTRALIERTVGLEKVLTCAGGISITNESLLEALLDAARVEGGHDRSNLQIMQIAQPTSADTPVLNRLIEDYLAHGGTPAEDAGLLDVWLRLGAEYLARAAGRQHTLDSLQATARFIREARPSREWKP